MYDPISRSSVAFYPDPAATRGKIETPYDER